MDASSDELSLDSDIAEAIQKMRCMSQKYIKVNEDHYGYKDEIASLKSELQNARETEKSQNNSINSSRKLIVSQQSIIAQLVNVKEEINQYKEELQTKDKHMNELETEISLLKQTFDKERNDLFSDYQSKLEKYKREYDLKVENLISELEAVKCKSECDIRSLKNKITILEEEKEEQISLLALEYEEKLQQANATILQKTNEIKIINDRNNANIVLYRKKIEDMEKSKLRENVVPINNFQIQPANDNYVTDTTNDFILKQKTKQRETFKIATNTNKRHMSTLDVKVTDCTMNREKDVEPPKLLVKPTKRKLFNKETDFYDFI